MNKPAAHGEVPLGGVIVILEIMSVMDAFVVEVPLPGHKLDAAFGGVARQHRVTKVSKDAVVTSEIGRLEPWGSFHSGHILQCLRGDVLDTKQGILCLWRVRILPAIVHAALAGDAAQRRIVPQDGEVAIFRRLCFKARTMERNANFFEVTELLSCVAAVHVVNLLFSVT